MTEEYQFFNEIYQLGKEEKLYKNVHIQYGEEEKSKSLIVLKRGVCSFSYLTKQGEERICRYFPENSIIGFKSFSTESEDVKLPYLSWMETKTDCIISRVCQMDIEEATKRDPDIARFIIDSLIRNYISVLGRCCQQLEESVPVQLCRLLLEEAYRDRESQQLVTPDFLTYREMSQYLGINEVTVSRIMKSLRQKGYIAREGRHVVIREPKELRTMIDFGSIVKY